MRHWGLRIDDCSGPWVSLGVHLDFQAPLVDLHVVWWLISFGRLYPGANILEVFRDHGRFPLFWKIVNINET